jgi:alkanesulfonate monooxygenase SsuD/methylene tetrahydromethanopterin reductase-like flavin-dependent oxidoreductase (luciferase family)
VLTELRTAKQLQDAAQLVPKEIMKEHVLISTEPQQYAEWLQQYIDLGFTTLVLHNVNLEQERFIEVFAEKVLPQVQQ